MRTHSVQLAKALTRTITADSVLKHSNKSNNNIINNLPVDRDAPDKNELSAALKRNYKCQAKRTIVVLYHKEALSPSQWRSTLCRIRKES